MTGHNDPADLVHGMPDLALLQDTDDLLDRLGRRRPTATDLDDPLFARLAEGALDLDLDAVPVERTHRALAGIGVWPPRQDLGRLVSGRAPDDDLDDLTPPAEAGLRTAVTPAARGPLTELFRVPATEDLPPVTRAQVRALDAGIRSSRAAGRSGLTAGLNLAGAQPRVIGLRLVPATAVAASVVALSMGAAAALSDGEGLTPAMKVVGQVFKIASLEDLGGDADVPPGADGSTLPGSAVPGSDPSVAPPGSIAPSLDGPPPAVVDPAEVPLSPLPANEPGDTLTPGGGQGEANGAPEAAPSAPSQTGGQASATAGASSPSSTWVPNPTPVYPTQAAPAAPTVAPSVTGTTPSSPVVTTTPATAPAPAASAATTTVAAVVTSVTRRGNPSARGQVKKSRRERPE